MPAIVDLRCEYLTNPLGLDVPEPRLTWRLDSDEPGAEQTAYRIRVGTAPGLADLWDTGRVEAKAGPNVAYEGKPVPSATKVWWRVTVWDQAGRELNSDEATWETGLLASDDWQAKWIQGPLCGGPRSTVPATYLSKEFATDKPIASARLYITALGLYVAELNGKKVGDHHLAPGWTHYHKRLRYQTFDVTDQLVSGENSLKVVLGDGWYCGHVGWRDRQFYGDRPKLLAQLELTHADGTKSVITSDESWKCGAGPILEADLLMGEAHDARRPIQYSWPIEVVEPKVGKLVAPACPPVRKMQELPAISVTENPQWPASRWIFDLGQNMVGHIRLKIKAQAGQNFTIRHAEVLDKDGKLYTENLRGATCVDYYTAIGEGEEIWEPSFTFHGFRYVEIAGFKEKPPLDAVTGIVVYTDLPQTGTFECSDPLINQLQKNILWGWRGNSVDVPTDCPQRDERLGWTGDAQVFAPTACFNTFALTFFEKYMQDMADAQMPDGSIPPIAPDIDINMPDGGPAWADAFVLVPWAVFRAYGDQRILKRHYPAMVRWIEQQERTSKNLIRCYEEYEGFKGFGDWLNIEAETPKDIIGTAYFAQSARVMATIAALCDGPGSRDRFSELADNIGKAFEAQYPTAELVKSQTAIVLALGYPNFSFKPLVSDQASLATALVDDIEARGDHLSTGFVGAPNVLDALTGIGRIDLGYRLLNQKTWPSWLYPVTQGATTIWERWDGWTDENGFQDKGMNSFNHYAYGSVGNWMYREILGLEIGLPGYRMFAWWPKPGGSLDWARGSLSTVYGDIIASWRRDGEFVNYEITIPPGLQGTVVVADWIIPEGNDGNDITFAAGIHRFRGRWPTWD